MNRTSLSLIGAWVVLVLVGLSAFSYYQQQYFENQLERNMNEIKEEMDNESVELEEEWETLDKSNPKKVLHYFELETYSYYYAYLLDFHQYLQRQERGNFITGTFATQACEGALLEGFFIIHLAHSHGVTELYSEGEYHEIFLNYSQKYEDTNQVFSWEAFKDSKEFGEFLDEFYHFLENKEEITLQETYQEIKDLEKADILNPYRKALLRSYVYLVETSYDNYDMHKNQNDFVKALIDAEVIYSVYRFSRHLDTKETALTTVMPFQHGIIYVHSSILDLSGVLIFSTFLVAVIWFVMREKSHLSD